MEINRREFIGATAIATFATVSAASGESSVGLHSPDEPPHDIKKYALRIGIGLREHGESRVNWLNGICDSLEVVGYFPDNECELWFPGDSAEVMESCCRANYIELLIHELGFGEHGRWVQQCLSQWLTRSRRTHIHVGFLRPDSSGYSYYTDHDFGEFRMRDKPDTLADLQKIQGELRDLSGNDRGIVYTGFVDSSRTKKGLAGLIHPWPTDPRHNLSRVSRLELCSTSTKKRLSDRELFGDVQSFRRIIRSQKSI